MSQIPDFVFDALRDPLLLQSEELLQWLEESEQNRALFAELCDFQEAAWRRLPENNPDMELQWERLKKRRSEKKHFFNLRNIQIKAISVAASVVFILLFCYLYTAHEKENMMAETEWILPDIPVKKNAMVAIKAVDKVQPILLSRDKKGTQSIYEKLLDYTNVNPEKVVAEKLTLTTPRGKSIKLLLSDGTEVWLNAESSLVYPSYFTDSTRVVELKGEAYFKVAKDSIHPFIVKHGDVMTRALGTEFNIRSYEAERKHVTLVEGSVLVADISSSQQHILSPGQDAAYNSSTSITVKEVNVLEYTAWTENLFYFDQTKLLDIMQMLGRWYNVTVLFEDKEAEQYHFTFWAECNGSLVDALSLLNRIGTVRAYWDPKNNRVIVKKR